MLDKKLPPLAAAALAAGVIWMVATALPVMALPLWLRLGGALLLAAAGGSLCIAGVMAFRRRGTTVDPRRPETTSSLVTSGVYAITRNPMYVGFVLLLLGWGVYLASPVSLLVVGAFILYLDRFQIRPEERALTAMFGQTFRDYQHRVRRWL